MALCHACQSDPHSKWVKLVQLVLQSASTMLPHPQSALTSNKACALAAQLAPLALHGLLLKLTRLAVNSRLLCGCLCCLLLLAGSSLLGFPLLVDPALLGSLFLRLLAVPASMWMRCSALQALNGWHGRAGSLLVPAGGLLLLSWRPAASYNGWFSASVALPKGHSNAPAASCIYAAACWALHSTKVKRCRPLHHVPAHTSLLSPLPSGAALAGRRHRHYSQMPSSAGSHPSWQPA